MSGDVRILVVEDDPELGPLVAKGLRLHHHAVDLAPTVSDAIDATTVVAYDVVCLDLGLPDGDGLDLCRRLRHDDLLQRPQRILALTARDSVVDRVAGLDAGADDYLVKPFAFDELLARLRALTRRAHEVDGILVVDDLEVDVVRHVVRRRGEAVELTGRELAVLRCFAERPGEVVSLEELLDRCWDSGADSLTSSVRVILSRLRRKLGPPDLIETVAGVGYRLVVSA